MVEPGCGVTSHPEANGLGPEMMVSGATVSGPAHAAVRPIVTRKDTARALTYRRIVSLLLCLVQPRGTRVENSTQNEQDTGALEGDRDTSRGNGTREHPRQPRARSTRASKACPGAQWGMTAFPIP